jgi:hypothetical protein
MNQISVHFLFSSKGKSSLADQPIQRTHVITSHAALSMENSPRKDLWRIIDFELDKCESPWHDKAAGLNYE